MTHKSPTTLPRGGPSDGGCAEDEPRADQPVRNVASSQQSLTLWQFLSFSVMHTFLAGLLALTSLRTLSRLGRAFGTLEWLINFKRRARFARTLDAISETPRSASDRRRVTRDHFMQTRCDKLFYLLFDCIPRDQATALFTIKNQHLVDDAIRRGRGVYIALSHHGAHHVAAMLMAVRGYKVAGVRDRKEGGLRQYVQRRFDRRYPEFRRMKVIFADAYPRDIYRCFQEGYVLGSAMDVQRVRHPNQRVEALTLFGRPRPFISGPLRVAARCGVPVLQAFIVSRGNFQYELDITGALLDPDEQGNEDVAVQKALKTYARTIERYVRLHPSLITRA